MSPSDFLPIYVFFLEMNLVYQRTPLYSYLLLMATFSFQVGSLYIHSCLNFPTMAIAVLAAKVTSPQLHGVHKAPQVFGVL